MPVDLFAAPSLILMLVSLAMFVAQAFAFIDSATHRSDAYLAADKLNKKAWMVILGLALAWHMLFWQPIGLVNLVGIVAAIVYLVDVRPALRYVTRR